MVQGLMKIEAGGTMSQKKNKVLKKAAQAVIREKFAADAINVHRENVVLRATLKRERNERLTYIGLWAGLFLSSLGYMLVTYYAGAMR